jgi:tetratricopeptide (TPR) repeat protein
LKTEILIKLGRLQEAYPIAKELYEKSMLHFDGNHELQARILTELAIAELELNQLKLSEEHINQAIEILFSHNAILVKSENILYKNDDLAYMYVVKGDLEYKKQNFKYAFEHYKAALNIFQLRYKVNEVDQLSELYYKMAITALQLEKTFVFKQFLAKHERDFGLDHSRTKALYNQIL